MNTQLSVRITVNGRLSERLTAAFDGMAPVRLRGATELFGGVADQAQLHGLLSRIRDLGLELTSVTVSEAEPMDGEEA